MRGEWVRFVFFLQQLPLILIAIRSLSSVTRKSVMVSLDDVIRRYPDGLPKLDPIEDMGITGDPELAAAVAEAAAVQKELEGNEGGLWAGWELVGWVQRGV
jgi:hypothetical protein